MTGARPPAAEAASPVTAGTEATAAAPPSPALFDELIDTLYALVRLMEEESERLAETGPTPALHELAQAKIRLTDRLDALSARMTRERADWLDRLEGEERTRLAEASAALRDAAVVNSDVLERQIDLSAELLREVGRELERLSGRRSTVYGRQGAIHTRDSRAPLSINRKY